MTSHDNASLLHKSIKFIFKAKKKTAESTFMGVMG